MKGWFMTYPMLLPHTLAWFMMPHIQTAGYKVTALSCVFVTFKPGFLTKTGQKSQWRTAVQLFFLDSILITTACDAASILLPFIKFLQSDLFTLGYR